MSNPNAARMSPSGGAVEAVAGQARSSVTTSLDSSSIFKVRTKTYSSSNESRRTRHLNRNLILLQKKAEVAKMLTTTGPRMTIPLEGIPSRVDATNRMSWRHGKADQGRMQMMGEGLDLLSRRSHETTTRIASPVLVLPGGRAHKEWRSVVRLTTMPLASANLSSPRNLTLTCARMNVVAMSASPTAIEATASARLKSAPTRSRARSRTTTKATSASKLRDKAITITVGVAAGTTWLTKSHQQSPPLLLARKVITRPQQPATPSRISFTTNSRGVTALLPVSSSSVDRMTTTRRREGLLRGEEVSATLAAQLKCEAIRKAAISRTITMAVVMEGRGSHRSTLPRMTTIMVPMKVRGITAGKVATTATIGSSSST